MYIFNNSLSIFQQVLLYILILILLYTVIFWAAKAYFNAKFDYDKKRYFFFKAVEEAEKTDIEELMKFQELKMDKSSNLEKTKNVEK